MSTNQTKSFGQRIIEISELPKKKYFFWSGFVGAFPTLAIFYLISPVFQTKMEDPQYDAMAFLISCLISTITVTFFVSASLDYMKYSPKVYGAVTNGTYLVLAKNRFVQGIFDLFTNSVEKKLNVIWNKRGKTIDQHTEQLEGHDYAIKNLKDENTELKSTIETIQENHKKERLEWNEDRKLDMEEIRRLNSEIIKKDELIKKLMPEQSKTETTEKDAQIIKKDNRLESI